MMVSRGGNNKAIHYGSFPFAVGHHRESCRTVLPIGLCLKLPLNQWHLMPGNVKAIDIHIAV